MFRIYFNYTTGKFVVQFLVWGLFWRSVRQGDNYIGNTIRSWDTYEGARGWVKTVGLDQAFCEQQQKSRPTFLYGQGAT